jgi:hypothetical protein
MPLLLSSLGDYMIWRRLSIQLTTAALVGTTIALAQNHAAPSAIVFRVVSATPGHEVRFRGVLLMLGQPMQVIEDVTPFEVRAEGDLVLGAFERHQDGPLLRLEMASDYPEPTVVTAPRVMVGQRIGGVATDFVQGY